MLEKDKADRRPIILPSIAFMLGILVGDRFSELYFLDEHLVGTGIVLIGCIFFINKGKSQKKQLSIVIPFAIGMILVSINLYILDADIEDIEDSSTEIQGRIVSVQVMDEKTEIVIKGKTNYLVNIYGDEQNLFSYENMGMIVSVHIKPEKPKTSGNIGGFNYRNYLYGRGISLYGSLKSKRLNCASDKWSVFYLPKAYVQKERDAFLKACFKDWDQRNFAAGVLFGLGRNISEETRNEFMEGGAGHILAVSGLHIGILYTAYKLVERKIGISSNFVKKSIMGFIFIIYGTAAMWSVSVTRAMLLILLKELAEVVNRRFDSLSSLILISDVMLAFRPYLIFSTGFQMSFLAVLSICFLRPKVMYLLKIVSKGKKSNLINIREEVSIFATMLSVQILMIPYTIFFYNRLAIMALINNWLITAISSLYVPIGAFAFILRVIIDGIGLDGGFFFQPIGIVLEVVGNGMVYLNRALLLNGNSVRTIVSPNPIILSGIMSAILFSSSEMYKIMISRNRVHALKNFFKLAIFSLIISSLLFFNPIYFADEVFLDVGQGDSIHLDWGMTDILIDGGGNRNYNIGKGVLRPYLLRKGTKALDLALYTHDHMDHYLGLEELNTVYPIKSILDKGIAGDMIEIDENRYIDILWPIPGNEKSDDENYFSRIFKVYDHGVITLVTGDITREGELALIEKYKSGELRAHILKIAHHGSRYSTCQEFIDAVKPNIAIISVGKNNYGHPAPSTIEKLESSGIIVYRTDRDGAIGVFVGKGKFFVCGNRRNMRIEEYSVT